MAKKKAVKVRKWVTCAEPGCKRRARTSQPYCGEHLKKFEKEKAAAAKQRKELIKKKRAVRKKTKIRRAGKAAVASLSRLLKAHCDKCGYTIRLSRKWIDVKRPICPSCMRNMVTELDGQTDADPRQLKLKGATSKRRKGRADPDAAKKIGEALKGGV